MTPDNMLPGTGTASADTDFITPTGDTTGVADLAAINTSLATAGVTWLGAGQFYINGPLVPAIGTILQGSGMDATFINVVGATMNGITKTYTMDSYIDIRDLQFVGPAGSTTGKGIAITGTPLTALRITNVTVAGFGGNGFDLTGPIVTEIDHCIAVSNGGDGFSLAGGTGAVTSTALIACYANANAGNGYHFDNNGDGTYTALIACAADSNLTGYFLNNCHDMTLSSCGCEQNGTETFAAGTETGFKIAGCTGIVLTGCFSFKTNGKGYWITDSTTPSHSSQIILLGCRDSSPQSAAGATAGIQVDASNSATIINENVHANAGTYTGLVRTGTIVHIRDDVSPSFDIMTAASMYVGASLGGAAPAGITYTDAAGAVGEIINETSGTNSGVEMLLFQPATATKRLIGSIVTGDSGGTRRFTVDTAGKTQWGPGSAATDCTIQRGGVALLTCDADFDINVIGKGLRIATGTNGRMGEATLVGGTVTVANTSVTANTLIFLTVHTPGGTQGDLSYSRVAGTSFTITSVNPLDTSVVSWLLIEKG